MDQQEELHYNRIAKAIEYILTNFKSQPNLDEVAEAVHLSPFHFQRLFTEWAGTSPKKFLQYISVQYAKSLLKEQQATLFDTTLETGLSSTSRLHDLFVKMEGMTPAEFKNGGESLNINYSFSSSPFGEILIASTEKGICHMAFFETKENALIDLQSRFPKANYTLSSDANQQNALGLFLKDWNQPNQVRLHLKGTDFQIKVWQCLLEIPMGKLKTYGAIANQIDCPAAARAVGTAIGSNPIAYLIPCHRVIQATGHIGGYMWGTTRKTAIIGWESAWPDPIQSL